MTAAPLVAPVMPALPVLSPELLATVLGAMCDEETISDRRLRQEPELPLNEWQGNA